MTVLLPARGPLTDRLLDYFAAKFTEIGAKILVGDAVKPEGGGWPATPGEGEFAPYVTVGTGTATLTADETASLAGQHLGWLCTYTLLSVGAVRQQADYVADVVRNTAVLFPGSEELLTLGTEEWAAESVRFTRMGSVDRNDATDPPYWQIADQTVIRITRGHKRTSR